MSNHSQVDGKPQNNVASIDEPGPLGQTLQIWHVTKTLSISATADLSTQIIADRRVPSNKSLIILGWSMKGATIWSGGTNVILEDTPASVVAVTVLQTNMPSSSTIGMLGGTTVGTVTPGAGMLSPLTAGKGLIFHRTGTFTAGGDITLHVWGILKDVSVSQDSFAT